MYPPQSPTRITNNSILKLSGAFHWVNTSRIRFWAFSYSIGDPCGRSDQLSMYFISAILFYLDGETHPCHEPQATIKNDLTKQDQLRPQKASVTCGQYSVVGSQADTSRRCRP